MNIAIFSSGVPSPVSCVFFSCAFLALAGCSAVPGQGPLTLDVDDVLAGSELSKGYVVLKLNSAIVGLMHSFKRPVLPEDFRKNLGPGKSSTIGVGDSLTVNIWEASPDGLFSTAERKHTSLQTVVDENGMIFIPYAGRVQAAGRSVEALRTSVEASLKGKAVDPQVQISVAENKSSTLTIVGDVNGPGQFPIPIKGLRLLDAVALAGGTREALFESIARITRGGRTATVRMEDVVTNPQNNIWLASGDSITVAHQPRTFSAFGAVKSSRLVPFQAEKLMLSEALAQVGGLSDRSADAGGVFLFRFEDRELARVLMPDRRDRLPVTTSGQVPVVYRLDFNQPDAFFLSQSFRMRDKDVIYVANHPTAELGKFLSMIVSPILGTARVVSDLGD
jgi:Periplasmic protein involved in polysaccharide export